VDDCVRRAAPPLNGRAAQPSELGGQGWCTGAASPPSHLGPAVGLAQAIAHVLARRVKLCFELFERVR
jgi:hypothetical protein